MREALLLFTGLTQDVWQELLYTVRTGLKTLLETGGLLTTPGSLLYANGPHAHA